MDVPKITEGTNSPRSSGGPDIVPAGAPAKAEIEKWMSSGSMEIKGNVYIQPDGKVLVVPAHLGSEDQAVLISIKIRPSVDINGLASEGIDMVDDPEATTKIIRKGVEKLEEAAQKGHSYANFFLGCLYLTGGNPLQQQVVTRSRVLAYKHFDAALRQGYSSAPLTLMTRFKSYSPSIKDDLEEWICQVTLHNATYPEKDSGVLLDISDFLMHNGNTELALAFFLKAAQVGNKKARDAIENKYKGFIASLELLVAKEDSLRRFSLSGYIGDCAPLIELKNFASEYKHAAAYHYMGCLEWYWPLKHPGLSLAFDQLSKSDRQKVAKSHFEAADKCGFGEPGTALYDLAELCRNDEVGVFRNLKSESYQYYKRAAEKGHIAAQKCVTEYEAADKEPLTLKKFGEGIMSYFDTSSDKQEKHGEDL